MKRQVLWLYVFALRSNWNCFQLQVEEANTREELVDLLQRVHGDCVECEHKLEKSLMANELEAAKALVITMRYLISLENSIKEKGNRIGVFLWDSELPKPLNCRRIFIVGSLHMHHVSSHPMDETE